MTRKRMLMYMYSFVPPTSGLQPGLLEKFTSAKTNEEKNLPQICGAKVYLIFVFSSILRFNLLKLFIMDPTLESVQVETYFTE